jgi:hypothetical protein
MTRKSLDVKSSIKNGSSLYKGGLTGESNTANFQFWATENPLNPGFADRYGIPPRNSNFSFILRGILKKE